MSGPRQRNWDLAACRELEVLLDAIHGEDRPTQGNGTYREPPSMWTHDEDGHYAEFPGYHLHVTSDGDVWLNTEVAAFDGICLASRLGVGTTEQSVADAIATLELALVRLRNFGKE